MKFGYRLVTDDRGRIEYKAAANGKKHFHVAVFVNEESEILETIRMVEYKLHDTFAQPVRQNDDRETGFTESFYTWGIFTVFVTVLFTNGQLEKFRFPLDYQLPPDHGLNYVQVPTD
jgi:transcription initiation factor IIF auxiliary subunit